MNDPMISMHLNRIACELMLQNNLTAIKMQLESGMISEEEYKKSLEEMLKSATIGRNISNHYL